jgi:hypothetical protein
MVFSFVSNVTWGSKVFTVTSLADAGPGSLRVSLNQANASKGADQIVFSVTGTILLSSSLPSIMDTVTIISDLGALGPLLQIDFNKNNGLVFAKGSLGSILSGLSLVNANNDALILNDKSNLISNNFKETGYELVPHQEAMSLVLSYLPKILVTRHLAANLLLFKEFELHQLQAVM